MACQVLSSASARASLPAQGMLLAFQCMRRTVINTFYGETWIASICEARIHWCFYEAVGGFLGNWAGFISLVILSLSFMRIKFPLDCAFYIRHPRRTILLHLQTLEFCRNSKFFFFFFFMNQKCRLDLGCHSWGKGNRGQRFSHLSTEQERRLSSFDQGQ